MKEQDEVPVSTITYDRQKIGAPVGNIYKAINVVAKRSEQINAEVRKELLEKLEEFAIPSPDNMEEIFDNKEQIEISRYYEGLPKSHSRALQEWLEDKVYYRDTSEEVQ